MFRKQKFIVIIFFLICQMSSFGQEERAIDNKGTLVTVRNNTVVTATTPPTNPLEGDFWINNTDPNNEIINIWDGTQWVVIKRGDSQTVILNRSASTGLATATNTFFNLPLTATRLQTINPDFYNLIGNNITILETGNYLISGEISVTNMPSGDTKFILGVFINNVRRGYLSRGFASLPSVDFWGTTGTLMYRLNAGDVISIRYVINAGGSVINSNFLNIGITKI